MSRRHLFGRSLAEGRLHFAAHSHHPWPDVTYHAHKQAWRDAAELMDHKWDKIFGEIIPEARGHVAGRLGLPDPATIVFAPNTHELVTRLTSSLASPMRVLTTDGEFHSFRRQCARWEQAGHATVTRVSVQPFPSFPERFIAAASGDHDLIYFSHVFYDSGYLVPDLVALISALPPDGVIVVDGYHGFMAVPTALGMVADRIFYVAGGYKYAMAGEGACFMHCPPGYGSRPVDTGWFAAMGDLEKDGGDVSFPTDGGRFWGATFDPSGLYRFNAVQRMLDEEGVTVAEIHRHVAALQERCVRLLTEGGVDLGELVPAWGTVPDRGHFLTHRSEAAAGWQGGLDARGVIVDRRGDRLRIGFGLYHEAEDVDNLLAVIDDIEVPAVTEEGAP